MRLLALTLPVLLAFAPSFDSGFALAQDRQDDIDAFAKQIEPRGDDAVTRFQKGLGTPAGKIVLRDRIEKAAEALRSQSERDAVPDYFKARFEESGGAYVLRKGQEEYRRAILEDYASSKADIDRIRPLVREVAD